jgi:4-aminobutyrate aminotransferase
MIGIELVNDKDTKAPLDADTMGSVVFDLLNRGIIMVPCGRFGNVLRYMPSLTITREHCQAAADILLDVVKDV